MRMAAFGVILALPLSACVSTGKADTKVMIFNPELRSASADHAATMTVKRTPMTMESGAIVSNCRDYLALRSHVGIAPTPDNRIASLEYVICDSVAVLQDALPVASADARNDMGAALANRLDMRSFRSSMHQRTTDEIFTLHALTDQPLQIGAHAAELDSPDWYFKLEVVAVADIDASGRPDWLLWVVDQSLEGTYLSVEPLIIRDPSASGLLEASPLPR